MYLSVFNINYLIKIFKYLTIIHNDMNTVYIALIITIHFWSLAISAGASWGQLWDDYH